MVTKFQQETLKSRFAQAKVLVVGDVMLDRYWFGDVSRISPEAPVPVAKIARIDQRAGGWRTLRAISLRWAAKLGCCR